MCLLSRSSSGCPHWGPGQPGGRSSSSSSSLCCLQGTVVPWAQQREQFVGEVAEVLDCLSAFGLQARGSAQHHLCCCQTRLGCSLSECSLWDRSSLDGSLKFLRHLMWKVQRIITQFPVGQSNISNFLIVFLLWKMWNTPQNCDYWRITFWNFLITWPAWHARCVASDQVISTWLNKGYCLLHLQTFSNLHLF